VLLVDVTGSSACRKTALREIEVTVFRGVSVYLYVPSTASQMRSSFIATKDCVKIRYIPLR
jgi:hypothetical protein